MKIRYVRNFHGSSAIQDINDWVARMGNIIISITPVVTVAGNIFYTVLYEEAE